jgi:hypothetical protein
MCGYKCYCNTYGQVYCTVTYFIFVPVAACIWQSFTLKTYIIMFGFKVSSVCGTYSTRDMDHYFF